MIYYLVGINIMKVELMQPYGYCAGVQNVIDRINEIISFYPDKKIFCVGQIVHNQIVNDELEKKGVCFIEKDQIDNLQEGVVVFSAHGTSSNTLDKAKEKGLEVFDLVCPFVRKTLILIRKSLEEKKGVIYIGVKNHAESNAALSISKNINFVTCLEDVACLNINNNEIIVINQTTLSILDIKDIYGEILKKYPQALIADEICNATRKRQTLLIEYDNKTDGIIIVGDKNSNNSKSLYEIAKKKSKDCLFISCYSELPLKWLIGKKSVSIMSGTSTPKVVVEEICEKLENYK